MNIVTFVGISILPWLNMMNDRCATHLRGFPYFYSPPQEQVVNPTDTIYVNEKDAMLAVIYDGQEVIGIATGIPMSSFYLAAHYFSPQVIAQFSKQGHDPEKIWYMGYFFLDAKFREDSTVVDSVYQVFAQRARELGKTQICYIDLIRKENDPRQPLDYCHPEPWETSVKGFIHSGVEIESTWPTVQTDGSVSDQTHKLYFLLKPL